MPGCISADAIAFRACVRVLVPTWVPRGRACVRGCGHLRVLAAGATWTSRTASAPWAARRYHTSVIDAAGAIYVIGGDISSIWSVTGYQDVWASTDGGARAGLALVLEVGCAGY
jgi:hypothetical protein